ncbi:hypothetical protein PORY_001047 [Pneumocystis oryctolagi]|uniref:Uncharacterized protein n=1 Tax=Pneumocystis oryctolagi TaxID=42067 RepID=A0ACB7CCK5_9ASCO|nr:hypothetical protein PORY_001047 [Pneumocystis oryctolagi]
MWHMRSKSIEDVFQTNRQVFYEINCVFVLKVLVCAQNFGEKRMVNVVSNCLRHRLQCIDFFTSRYCTHRRLFYALDVTDMDILYYVFEDCWMLQQNIQAHSALQNEIDEKKEVFLHSNSLKIFETNILLYIRLLYDIIFLNSTRKGLFLIAFFQILNIQSFNWFCSTKHKKEMNALLVLLNEFFGIYIYIFDILFKNDIGKNMIILLLSYSEKMYLDEESNNFELLKLTERRQSLFFLFIQNDKMQDVFTFINEKSSSITDSQLIFLKFLNTFLSNYKNQNIVISKKLCEFIESFLDRFCLLMIEMLKIYAQVSDEVIIAKNKKILRATEILISCAFHVSRNTETKQFLLKNNLLKNLIDLLRQLDFYSVKEKKICNILSDDIKKAKFPYFKRDIIQLLSTLCYRDKKVQDDIRELHGLNLILSQCNIDDENPYLREYAIFCLKNVLENNEENKKLLKEMKPIGLFYSEFVDELDSTSKIIDENYIRVERHKL